MGTLNKKALFDKSLLGMGVYDITVIKAVSIDSMYVFWDSFRLYRICLFKQCNMCIWLAIVWQL